MIYIDEINGILLKKLGTIIQTGTADLLTFPERKDLLENDWAEENGGEYDLTTPKFKDQEVTLKFAILAKDDAEFWKHRNALFQEFSKPHFQRLYIADHSRHYAVFYRKSSNFVKSLKRLRGVEKVFVKFDVTFKVAYDNKAIDGDYISEAGLRVHRYFSREENTATIKSVAKLITPHEAVELAENSPKSLSNNIFQPNIDGYISGRRAKFVMLDSVSRQTIRRHLSKCQKKKAETIVFISNENNERIWREAIKEALKYVSKYFNPEFRFFFSNQISYWEY